MTKRHAAAALSMLLLGFAALFSTPAFAAGDSSELMAAVKNVSTQADKSPFDDE